VPLGSRTTPSPYSAEALHATFRRLVSQGTQRFLATL
jgi:hypothetical protein